MKRRVPFAQLPPGGLMTTADVQIALGASDRQVRAWAAAGDLVAEETWGGQWIFRKRSVEAFRLESLGGARAVLPPRVGPTGQLGLPVRRARFVRPRPQSWKLARFTPRMIPMGLARRRGEEAIRRVG